MGVVAELVGAFSYGFGESVWSYVGNERVVPAPWLGASAGNGPEPVATERSGSSGLGWILPGAQQMWAEEFVRREATEADVLLRFGWMVFVWRREIFRNPHRRCVRAPRCTWWKHDVVLKAKMVL